MAWTMLRVLLVFFASFSQLFGFRRVEAGPCMADWTLFQGSCYFFSTETATWNSARESCQGSGGDLITVSSDSENAFAISHASSLHCLTDRTWLGLRRDPRNTSRWIWPDKNNTELNYTKWHRKRSLHPSPEKNCSEIRPTISIFWYGRECTAQGCYICETDANECSVENVCSGQPCLNVPGGYTCVCGEGFLETMDKKDCKDRDECGLDNGGCPHTCINTQGSYVCQCRDGYITEQNGTVCRPTLVEYTSASKRNSATESYNRTTAINAVTRPSETETSQKNEEQQSGSDNGIEKPQESPSASFGVLLTMAIPLCFIVCFLILCYLKGPGKDKNKELGSTGRLVQSAAPFADTAFMDPVNSRAGKKCRNMKETKNGRHPEEEPMV